MTRDHDPETGCFWLMVIGGVLAVLSCAAGTWLVAQIDDPTMIIGIVLLIIILLWMLENWLSRRK